jgi:hypothetical protein
MEILQKLKSHAHVLYVLSSNPVHGEVYSIQHVIQFVCDLRQVGGFLSDNRQVHYLRLSFPTCRLSLRKPPTCRKSQTNCITCCIEYTSPWTGFELRTYRTCVFYANKDNNSFKNSNIVRSNFLSEMRFFVCPHGNKQAWIAFRNSYLEFRRS